MRSEARGYEKALHSTAHIAIPIPGMAHLTVVVMTEALTFGKIPDTAFTDTVWGPVWMDSAQVHTLSLLRFTPGCVTAERTFAS
jgi:hypothetical protein